MKPGATLGLSHGFLLGVMQSDGADFREDIDVVLMAPKVPLAFLLLQPSAHSDPADTDGSQLQGSPASLASSTCHLLFASKKRSGEPSSARIFNPYGSTQRLYLQERNMRLRLIEPGTNFCVSHEQLSV